MSTVYYVLLFSLWLTGVTMAQQVPLRVHVSDKRSQENLLGATVCYRQHRQIVRFTDLMGNAYLPILQKADTIEIRYVGFRNYRFVCQPADTLIEVRMIPESNLLAIVKVSAKRPIAEEFVLKKLNFLDIVTIPSSYADPLLAVRSLPSATNTDESATVSFRGNSPSATGLILNDVPIYDVSKFAQLSGVGTFSIFPLPLVSEVLSFAANPPLEFGHASSGLIQVTTSDKQTPQFLSATLGLANSNLVVGQPMGRNWMMKAFIGFQSGPLLKTLNPHSFQDIRTFDLLDGGWHLARQTERSSFKFYGYLLKEHFVTNQPEAGYSALFESRKKRILMTSQYVHRFSRGEWSVSSSVSQSGSTAGEGIYQEKKQPLDIFGSASIRYFLNKTMSIKAGLTTDQRKIKTGGVYPIYTSLLRPGDPAIADTSTNWLHLLESYAYLKYKPSDHWTWGGGIRHGWVEGKHTTAAQSSIRFNKNENQFINLGLGQYYTYSLVLTDRYRYLKYSSRQVSLDYSFMGERFSGTASAFGQQQITPEAFSTWGIEGSIKWTLFQYTTVETSCSLIQSPHKLTSDSAVSVGSLLSNRNGLYGKATVQQHFGFWTLSASATYHNQRYVAEATNPIYVTALNAYLPKSQVKNLPAYIRCDVTVNRLFIFKNRQVVTFLTVANVFNTANSRGLSYNATYSEASNLYFQKRFVYLGISVSFQK